MHFLNVGVPDVDIASTLKIWPNPAHDVVTVEGEGVCRVELYDMVGRLVAVKSAESESCCAVSVSQLPAGIYMMKVYTDTGVSQTRKVVVE